MTPARIVAGVCLLWMLIARVRGGLGLASEPNLVRRTVALAMAAYAAAHALAMLDSAAVGLLLGSDRTVMLLALAVAVALLACDGIRTTAGIRWVFGAIVLATSVSVAAAVLASRAGIEIRSWTALPGFTVQPVMEDQAPRYGVVRALGFTNHPIELAALAVAALPIALHLARWAARARPLWWACVALLVVGPLASVARTGLLALAVVLLALQPRLGLARWLAALAGTLAGTIALALAVPALFDPVVRTMVDSGVDYSIVSRLTDYAYVVEQVAQRPLAGQGVGTYLAPPQRFLDNQYLFTLVESGLLGLIGLLALLFVPAVAGFAVFQSTRDCDDGIGDAGWAVGTALLVCTAAAGSFDGLAFSQFQGLVFLLIGLSGAVYAIARAGRPRSGGTLA